MIIAFLIGIFFLILLCVFARKSMDTYDCKKPDEHILPLMIFEEDNDNNNENDQRQSDADSDPGEDFEEF